MEVCCGHAGLSVALQRLGWDVRPIDWVGNEHKPKIPVMHKNLRNPTHIADIMKMLKTVSYLHFAPPCGTASKARDRWWVKMENGRPPPPPLRSAAWPMGREGLSYYNQQKVESANKIYEAVAKIILECHRLGVAFTIENPSGSCMWAYPAIEKAMESINTIDVDLQACMFGSKRDKWTRIVTKRKEFQVLGVACDKSHKHDPWGRVLTKDKGWTWATNLECECTEGLCTAIAEAASMTLKDKPLPTPAPKRTRKQASTNHSLTEVRADAGRQTKRAHNTNSPERKPKKWIKIKSINQLRVEAGPMKNDPPK